MDTVYRHLAQAGRSRFISPRTLCGNATPAREAGSRANARDLVPVLAEFVDEADGPRLEVDEHATRAPGAVFTSFHSPEEMLALVRGPAPGDALYISSRSLIDRYFAGRPDGLHPSSGEDVLLATTFACSQPYRGSRDPPNRLGSSSHHRSA